jgi:predicted RecB family nuclease
LRRCEIKTYNRDDVLAIRALEMWVRSFTADKAPAAQD